MSNTVEAVSLKPRRSVNIQIKNKTSNYTLIDPRNQLESGNRSSPANPSVRQNILGNIVFATQSIDLKGVGGVLTYEVVDSRNTKVVGLVAIMFSAPFNYVQNQHSFAVGCLEKDGADIQSLYEKMHRGEQRGFVRAEARGSALTYEDAILRILATMSMEGFMKVEVLDKN